MPTKVNEMFERKLFLGCQVDASFEKHLSKTSPQLISLFIQPKGEYLHQMIYQDQRYLGRFITSPSNLSEIELLELHVFSLLKRLVPDYSYENAPLWLFPIVDVMIPSNEEGVSIGRD
jgi:hypothetical protein